MKTKFSFNPLSGEFDLVTSELNANEVVNVPSGNLAATDVQGALNELQTDINGRVAGPASATDDAIVRYDGTTGKLVQNSLATINDVGVIATADGTSSLPAFSFTSQPSMGIYRAAAGILGISPSGALRAEFANTYISLMNPTRFTDGNASAPALTFSLDTTTGFYRSGSNAVITAVATADRFTVRAPTSTSADAEVHGTAGLELPVGTTAQRPSTPIAGTIRHNSDADQFEGYYNTSWQPLSVNEQPLTNYLRPIATASQSAGTLSTVAANGSVTTSAWFSTSTGTAFTITQDTSTPIRGLSSYLTASNTAASTDGSVFFQLPRFQLELADRGKPVSLSLDISGVTAANQWDVVVVRYNNAGTFQELIPVAGTASNASGVAANGLGVPSAQVPSGQATMRGFFVPASDDSFYAVRFRRLSGSTQIEFDTLYVGPQVQLSGAAVTDWQSYTPAVTGFTTSSLAGFWRRVGGNVELRVSATLNAAASGTMQVGLPSGLTIDSTYAPGGTEGPNFGTVKATKSGVGYHQGIVTQGNSNTALRFLDDDGALTYNATIPFTWANADSFDLEASVPISNWSSNTTMAERAVEEYAFNTAATTAAGGSDTTSFGYGAAGTPFNSFDSTTSASNTSLRCRFQTPIQSTDKIVLEFLRDASSSWQEVAVNNVSVSPYQNQNDLFYGMGWVRVSNSTTDIDVIFGNRGRTPSTTAGAGFGVTGVTWAGATGWRWRVRKVSGGAVVGYPVGARNVVGDTTGTAVPAGFIGELLDNESGTVTMASNVYTATTTKTFTTPGVYSVSAHVRVNVLGTMSTAEYVADLKGGSSGNAPYYADTWIFSSTNTPTRVSLTVPPFTVRYNGTNIVFPDGSTVSGATITLNVYAGIYTGTNNTAIGVIRATRIA